MLIIEIRHEHNDNEIHIIKVEHFVQGKNSIVEAACRLMDQAKKEFEAALKAS